MANYSGSFSGSFQGTISGSLLGSGIVSASTQIDFNDIVNKPTTIQPFQANSIVSNNRFREVTYPAISASTSTRFTTIESSVSTLSGQIQAAVSGTVPPGTISGSAQIAALGYLTSASAAAAGFGTALFPSGLLSSSFQIATDISGAFTSLSSSFASRITTLEGAGGGNGIFTLTGSFYSTTNNIQITGSLSISSGSLSISSGSFKAFEVNSDGFVVLGDMDKDLNNAPIGTIAYSASSFYLIS